MAADNNKYSAFGTDGTNMKNTERNKLYGKLIMTSVEMPNAPYSNRCAACKNSVTYI